MVVKRQSRAGTKGPATDTPPTKHKKQQGAFPEERKICMHKLGQKESKKTRQKDLDLPRSSVRGKGCVPPTNAAGRPTPSRFHRIACGQRLGNFRTRRTFCSTPVLTRLETLRLARRLERSPRNQTAGRGCVSCAPSDDGGQGPQSSCSTPATRLETLRLARRLERSPRLDGVTAGR